MRGKKAPRHILVPDQRYKSIVVTKFINQVMRKGKKSIAEKVIYSCFDTIKNTAKTDPLETFEKAMSNVSPVLEVKSRRIGGANYQIPIEVRGDRKSTLALRWIIQAARSKKGKPIGEKLAIEIIDAANMRGDSIKKKTDVQRMAESNRAFAHFA